MITRAFLRLRCSLTCLRSHLFSDIAPEEFPVLSPTNDEHFVPAVPYRVYLAKLEEALMRLAPRLKLMLHAECSNRRAVSAHHEDIVCSSHGVLHRKGRRSFEHRPGVVSVLRLIRRRLRPHPEWAGPHRTCCTSGASASRSSSRQARCSGTSAPSGCPAPAPQSTYA